MLRFWGRGVKNQYPVTSGSIDFRSIIDDHTLNDADFISACYQFFLKRPADPSGLKYYEKLLGKGEHRIVFIQHLMHSEEFRRLHSRDINYPLPELLSLRPENYQVRYTQDDNEEWRVFKVLSPADYDWLEKQILDHGYYDRLSVWSFEMDEDKKNTAEIALCFAPRNCLEIGCSTGGVLKILRDEGVAAEGVEISHMALAKALPEVRRSIHFGDLLDLALEPKYDLLLGMDVFEHLNPNRLGAYTKECRRLLGQDGGYLLANIPAYGRDEVFGTIHPYKLADWEQEARDPGLFSVVHADAEGWPINGHLIWADTHWWQGQFKAAGLLREMDIEHALHARYDDFFRSNSPARLSFYVFSAKRSRDNAREVIRKIDS
jgi:2-polyprenyl-3-methyl-5-hydroxy-6-metoxy-1,4-benzoquinol methylase